MLDNIFQNSKAAMGFGALVIVAALVLIGPDEGGGVMGLANNSPSEEAKGEPAVAGTAPNSIQQVDDFDFGNDQASDTQSWNNSSNSDAVDGATPWDNPSVDHGVDQSGSTRQSFGVSAAASGAGSSSGEPALPPGMPRQGAPSLQNATPASD
jgi:hypothetical protein